MTEKKDVSIGCVEGFIEQIKAMQGIAKVSKQLYGILEEGGLIESSNLGEGGIHKTEVDSDHLIHNKGMGIIIDNSKKNCEFGIETSQGKEQLDNIVSIIQENNIGSKRFEIGKGIWFQILSEVGKKNSNIIEIVDIGSGIMNVIIKHPKGSSRVNFRIIEGKNDTFQFHQYNVMIHM